MQITINLSSTPYLDVEPLIRKLRMIAVALGLLTVSAALLLVAAHVRTEHMEAEEQHLDSAILRQSEDLSTYRKMLEMPENVGIANRALALNSLFDEKSFSWTLLMKQFERLVPPEVQLATIQPIRSKDGTISIRMHVIGPREKVVELVHGIELSKNFTLPHVTAETAHNNDARPNQRASALTASSVEEFDIEAGYDEDNSWTPATSGGAGQDRETASAVPMNAGRKTTVPVQLAATAVTASLPPSGGAR